MWVFFVFVTLKGSTFDYFIIFRYWVNESDFSKLIEKRDKPVVIWLTFFIKTLLQDFCVGINWDDNCFFDVRTIKRGVIYVGTFFFGKKREYFFDVFDVMFTLFVDVEKRRGRKIF